MSVSVKKIADNAECLFVRSNRFNTTLVSFNFYLPLSKDTVAPYALLPFVLTTCGKEYPDFSKLNFKLSRLYGAELVASSEKVGDFQLLKVGISVINDRFTLDSESLVSDACDMLESLIFEPKAENESFCEEDVEREKQKAVFHVMGEFSDKRVYSKKRLISAMYDGLPYGVPKCGTVEQIKALNGKALYKAWKDVLSKAFIRVNIISDTLLQGLTDRIASRLSSVERSCAVDFSDNINLSPAENVNRIDEPSEVTQGKLVMGFTSLLCGNDKDTVPLMLMCDIFGGGPYSRLFSNVREKMSLCYYCAARTVRVKGLLTVESGVEKENIEKTEKAVLEQLDIMKQGGFSDFEFESSKKSCIDSINTYNDSQALLDTWYSLKIFDGEPAEPETLSGLIGGVTREDVIKAAQGIKLHTVFRLLPKAANEGGQAK